MKKSSVSRMPRFLFFFRFCVMTWKGESQTNIKFCLGRTIELVQRFTTTQNFGHNWWWANGIRVEYFSHDSLHCSSSIKSKKAHEQNERHRTVPRTNYLHVDVQWRHMVIRKTMNRNANWAPNSFRLMREDLHQGRWSFLGPGTEKSGIQLTLTDHKENGTESLNRWWSNSEKADTHFSETSIVPEERSKADGGGKLSIHFCADGSAIETVFRTIISANQLSIYGPVSAFCDE